MLSIVEFKDTGFGQEREKDFTVTDIKIEKSKIARPDGSMGEQIHLILEDMEHVWKPQHEWYGLSQSFGSAFVELVLRLKKLDVLDGKDIEDAKTSKDLAEIIKQKLKDKQFHWKEEKVGRKQGFTWMPKREV